MNDEQADSVLGHSARLRSLKQAQDIFKELGGALGASLMEAVSRVMHTETKRFITLMQGDENVVQEVRAGLEAEEAISRRERVKFQAHMQQTRERVRAEQALEDTKAKLRMARKEQRDAEAVVTAREEVNVYSFEMLGTMNKHESIQNHNKARLGVLQRFAQGSRIVVRADEQVEVFQNDLGRRDGGGFGSGLGGIVCRVCTTIAQLPRRGTK